MGGASRFSWRPCRPFGFWLRKSLPETLHGGSRHAGCRNQDFLPSRSRAAIGASWRSARPARHDGIAAYIQIYAVTYAQDTLHLSGALGFLAETANAAIGVPAMLSWRLGFRPSRSLAAEHTGKFRVSLSRFTRCLLGSCEAPSAAVLVSGDDRARHRISNVDVRIRMHRARREPAQDIRCSGLGLVYSVAIAACGGLIQICGDMADP